MNLQVIAAPDGEIVGVSGPLPGAVHDLTAARNWGIIRCLVAAGPVTLGGKGCQRVGDLIMTRTRQEQARLAERRQPRTREATRPKGTRQRPAQDLAVECRGAPIGDPKVLPGRLGAVPGD